MGNFSDHVVNQRFRELYQKLEDQNRIKGKSDIAKKLGTYNHVINSILKGQRNITLDQLNKLFEHYGVNANYIFGNSPDMFLDTLSADGQLAVRDLHDRQIGGRDNITLIPHRALAGDAVEVQETIDTTSLPAFSVPGFEGELIGIEISGDSMLPTITNGDIVICERIERDTPLRDNHVYVIVTDVVVAKRIQQIRNGNQIQALKLISDNDAVYKPYTVELQDIRHLFKVKCRLTTHAIS